MVNCMAAGINKGIIVEIKVVIGTEGVVERVDASLQPTIAYPLDRSNRNYSLYGIVNSWLKGYGEPTNFESACHWSAIKVLEEFERPCYTAVTG